jgi:hypothetical protein
VGLFAIVLALGLAFLIAVILALVLKRFVIATWGKSIGFGIAAGLSVSGALLYQGFRPLSWEVSQSDAEERFPQLRLYDAKFQNGLSFQDGLSDGEYYCFVLDKEVMTSMQREIAKTRRKLNAGDPFDMRHSHSSNLEPPWFAGSDCEDGRHYAYVKRRDETSPYLDRFTLHFCPQTGELFADWVRI